jgi:hypothetical protein
MQDSSSGQAKVAGSGLWEELAPKYVAQNPDTPARTLDGEAASFVNEAVAKGLLLTGDAPMPLP